MHICTFHVPFFDGPGGQDRLDAIWGGGPQSMDRNLLCGTQIDVLLTTWLHFTLSWVVSVMAAASSYKGDIRFKGHAHLNDYFSFHLRKQMRFYNG